METNRATVKSVVLDSFSYFSKGTVFSSIFNLLTTSIGAGTLALPYAFRQGGLVFASVLFLVILIIAIIVGLFLYDSQDISRKLFPSVEIKGYADLAELTFGRIGRITVMAVLLVFLYLTLVAYMIYSRDQLQLIIDFALRESNHIPQCWIFHNCAIVTSMAFLPLFPITLLKNLSPLQFTSTISIHDNMCNKRQYTITCTCSSLVYGVLFVMVYLNFKNSNSTLSASNNDVPPFSILCIVFVAIFMGIEAGRYFSDGAVHNATEIVIISSNKVQSEIGLLPSTVQGAITCISYSGLCFLCHFQLFSLKNELHKPKRWKLNFIVVSSMLIAYGIYNVVAFAGYLHFGGLTNEDVMTNFPSNGVLETTARSALFLTLLFSYPVLFHPTRAVINEIVHYVHQLFKQRDNTYCTIQTSDSEDDTLLGTSNNMFSTKERNMLYRREVNPSNIIWVCESWILFCLAFLPASFIPSVGYVWNFVGAIGGTLILYIFPPLFFLRLRYFSSMRAASRIQNPTHSVWYYYCNITVWKDIAAVAIILLGVFILVAGNYVAVEAIVRGHGESFSSCLEYNCHKNTTH